MKTLHVRHWLFAVIASVVAIVPAPMAQQATRTTATADIPRLTFEKYTLPNGLDVILSEDHRLPMVAVNLWYHVGPANEEPDAPASRTCSST